MVAVRRWSRQSPHSSAPANKLLHDYATELARSANNKNRVRHHCPLFHFGLLTTDFFWRLRALFVLKGDSVSRFIVRSSPRNWGFEWKRSKSGCTRSLVTAGALWSTASLSRPSAFALSPKLM